MRLIIKRNLKMDQFGDFENNHEDDFKPAQWPTSQFGSAGIGFT